MAKHWDASDHQNFQKENGQEVESSSAINAAWHAARDDEQSAGELNSRASSKEADSVEKDSGLQSRAEAAAAKLMYDAIPESGSSK